MIDIIKKYIDDSTYNYALLLDGEWGSGKTYYIKNEIIPAINKKTIIYLTLFGIEDKTTIKSEIIAKSLIKSDNESINGFIDSIITSIDISGIANKGNIKLDNMDKILEKIDTKNTVIIFDDLERCKLDLQEIFGLINYYVEHVGIKCIIVANTQEIDKINEFNKCCEKIIGTRIKFKSNYEEIVTKFIENQEFSNNEVLKNRKFIGELIDISEKLNNHNLRTFQFFLSKIKAIYNEINIKTQKEILEDIARYCFIISISFKDGRKLNSWGLADYGRYNYLSENELDPTFEIEGFKFVDDYVVNSILDKDYINTTIEKYYVEKNTIPKEDPLNLIRLWFENNDNYLNNNIDLIENKLKNNEYNYGTYPKIIEELSAIYAYGVFDIEKLINIRDQMIENIKKGKFQETCDWYAHFLDGEAEFVYDDITKSIIESCNIEIKNNHKELIDSYLDKENWGTLIVEDYYNNCKKYGFRIFEDIDVNKLYLAIEKTNEKSISDFRRTISSFSSHINVKEYFVYDIEKIKELVALLNKININNYGKVMQMNINGLNRTLNNILTKC